jgi:hypothetical protein
MPKAYWDTQLQRTKVLKLPRDLARFGHNRHSILPELEAVEGSAVAHRCLTDRAISAQVDRLCAIAQAPALAGVPISLSFSLRRTNGTEQGSAQPELGRVRV